MGLIGYYLKWFFWTGAWSPAVAVGLALVIVFKAREEAWGSVAFGGAVLLAQFYLAYAGRRTRDREP